MTVVNTYVDELQPPSGLTFSIFAPRPTERSYMPCSRPCMSIYEVETKTLTKPDSLWTHLSRENRMDSPRP